MKKIEFYKHNLNHLDLQECVKVLNGLFLTTGETVKKFETKFAKYLSAKHALGVTSCTDGLFLALKCIGTSKGDEVITSPLSFIATANVIEYCGATPVFVDVEEETGNIDINLIEKAITKKTKAIIVVHLYGQMCDMKKLREIADKRGIKIIEDSAHCIEGKRENIKPGQLGDISVFSFYATKNITSGEGGAIVTNNDKYYEWLYKARLHGMSKSAIDRYSKKYEHYDMEFLGFKCNMGNIQASLLVNQINRMENLLEKKERIAQRYDKGFKKNPLIKLPKVLPKTKHARHIYTIWVPEKKRNLFLHQLQNNGIGVAVNFRAIHLMEYYKKKYKYKKGDYPKAERIGNSTITLPFYPKLKTSEIQYVIERVNTIIAQ